MTQAQTETQTETQVELDVTLDKLITESVGHEKKAESKYSLLIERAIEMFEEGRDQKAIMLQFRLAYAKAYKCEWKEFNKNPEYVNARRKAGMFVNIAARGRNWYQEHKKEGDGFYRMYELCKVDEEPEAKPKKGKPKVETEDNEPEAAAPPKPSLADKQWFIKCRHIVKNEPDAFIKMIKDLIDKGQLPDTILEPIRQHLKGE